MYYIIMQGTNTFFKDFNK